MPLPKVRINVNGVFAARVDWLPSCTQFAKQTIVAFTKLCSVVTMRVRGSTQIHSRRFSLALRRSSPYCHRNTSNRSYHMSSLNTQTAPARPTPPKSNIPAKPGWNELPTFTGVAKIFGWLTAATFSVPLKDGRSVHMQAELPGGEDCYAVVLVDAARFLQLWRSPQSSHREVALLDAATWPTDYKYLDAVEGFSHGAENPVALAEVSCGLISQDIVERHCSFLWWKTDVMVARKGEVFLSFTNGITRMIYLLANGAKEFPARRERRTAGLLFRLAGSANHPLLLLSSSKHRSGRQDCLEHTANSPGYLNRWSGFFRLYKRRCRWRGKGSGRKWIRQKNPAHLAPEY